MIPVEAIEAVATRLYPDWQNAPADWQDYFRRKTTDALEAAAPHMQSAWHDAVAEAYVEGALSAEQANVMWAKNPYRRADAV